MKIPVSNNDILSLKKNKHVLLIKNGRIYGLSNFEITEEEKIKKYLFRKPRVKRQKYLTSAIVLAYHSTGDFIGELDDNATKIFLTYNDLYELRQNFKDFEKMLNAFGFTIEKTIEKIKQ